MTDFNGMDIVRKTCGYAKKIGADKAQIRLARGEKYELNVEAGKMSLYRTTVDVSLGITVHSENRKGTVTVNRYDDDTMQKAAQDALDMAKASEPDSANDISPEHPLECFENGPGEADSAVMYDRLNEFLEYCGSTYPNTNLEQCILDFNCGETFFANTNGAEFESHSGLYNFFAMFTTKIGTKASSFNYSGASHRDMSKQLRQWGNIDDLMRQSTEQTDVKPVDGSFTGDIIITPDSLSDFIGFLEDVYMGDYPLITGNSPWKDMLGKQVASGLLTLRCEPQGPSIETGYHFTGDGFRAENCNLIENGILSNFTLGLYGSNKTGKPRCPSGGGALIIQSGSSTLAGMIADVKRGILLGRFSGGNPSDNGDFSGVAKNSYIIENGKITRPVGETMIAGNLGSLFKELRAVSREEINYGSAIMPWILSSGITISG
ncbi:MAG: TldD/PmbA family protein [Treponema sp.]|nr:TldD/PmbA family protein [Treponema sp.]